MVTGFARVLALLTTLAVLLLGGSRASAGPIYDGPAVHVGDNAPLFLLPALNTEPAIRMVNRTAVSLSDLTGVEPAYPASLVILHFCTKAAGAPDLAVLDRVARKHYNRGLRVLGVVADSSDVPIVSSWVEGLELGIPVLQDRFGAVVGRYGVRTFPLTVVIDASGDIVALGVPGANMEGELEALVAAHLP